jgi:hypothetical protein
MFHLGLGYVVQTKPRVERVVTERKVVVNREPPRLVVRTAASSS